MISSIIQELYEWARKERQRIYDLLNAETKPKILYGLHQAQALTPLITPYGVF